MPEHLHEIAMRRTSTMDEVAFGKYELDSLFGEHMLGTLVARIGSCAPYGGR